MEHNTLPHTTQLVLRKESGKTPGQLHLGSFEGVAEVNMRLQQNQTRLSKDSITRSNSSDRYGEGLEG